MDKINGNEKAGEVKQKMQNQISRITQMIKENKKVVIVIVLFLVLILGMILVINFSEKQEEVAATVEIEAAKEEDTDTIAVPAEALEKDAYAEVNNLVNQYYQALVDGDMDTIKSIKNYIDEEEELKIVKKSEFIEGYPVITVYTKKGPVEGSFVAYVQYEVKFKDIENTAPGLNTLYICTNEDGNYYINANELDESVVEYLKTISVQNDVLDLFNTVQVAYNDIRTQDESLSAFLDELPNLLAEAVSEAIIEQEEAEASLNPEEAEPEVIVVVTKVKTTAVVNVRSSDSVEADKIGKTTEGQILELVEERVNGWSKVMFEGKEGFIKTEFLQPEETEMKVSTEIAAETASDSQENTTSESNPSESEKGVITETVNVRKTPSTDANIVGLLRKGSELEIIEQMNNGWTKIKYSDGEAYVKSDYVTVGAAEDNSEETESNPSETKKGKLTETVNIRKTPGTDGNIMGLLRKGSELEIIEQMNNGWTKIKYSNGEAYVKSDYVEVS